MEKRYQVFVSSTFTDLIDERQAAIKAILELDHIPAGMELFPASDEAAWELIRDVIRVSDYYVLIVGGRYGSMDETGIGYTEKEYDYAVSEKKPIIPFLHQNPDNLPRGKTETDAKAWDKLKQFREKIEKAHTCVYWNSADSLKASIVLGITSAAKRHPAIGWVRADQVPSEATIADVLSLRQQVSVLTYELDKARKMPPPGTEELMQGDDTYEINFSFNARPEGGSYSDQVPYTGSIQPSWNDIFAGVAPQLIDEASESRLRSNLKKHLTSIAYRSMKASKALKKQRLSDFSFSDTELDTCIIQMRALGLIRESSKKKSVTDKATYWALTPYGDQLMVKLRAIKKDQT